MRGQGAAQFPGGEGAAVQAKTVAVFAGGEAVLEDAGQMFRGNADAIVNDGDDGRWRAVVFPRGR